MISTFVGVLVEIWKPLRHDVKMATVAATQSSRSVINDKKHLPNLSRRPSLPCRYFKNSGQRKL